MGAWCYFKEARQQTVFRNGVMESWWPKVEVVCDENNMLRRRAPVGGCVPFIARSGFALACKLPLISFEPRGVLGGRL